MPLTDSTLLSLPPLNSGCCVYSGVQYIKFGILKDRDLTLNIRSGKLRLTGTEVASIFLVGGFAASDWLFKQLRDISGDGINVSRPDSHVNKAIADGVISFYLNNFVSARIARFDRGTPMSMIDRPDPGHQSKSGRLHWTIWQDLD
ncbi:hypothetical protein CVT24_012766 [Panaeolus cyanescens]|uniref:Uncharacterized protein n=1 Tax=Panaeolus cyanescens TaxID=181874 RepID=A0A409YJD3_9AGAR|nr:hypothetical protein CVT24_012766 [Panaeolus cyanescens]